MAREQETAEGRLVNFICDECGRPIPADEIVWDTVEDGSRQPFHEACADSMYDEDDRATEG